eukprot:scaffold18121_cov117-Isochrysis_galbana.AAC.3
MGPRRQLRCGGPSRKEHALWGRLSELPASARRTSGAPRRQCSGSGGTSAQSRSPSRSGPAGSGAEVLALQQRNQKKHGSYGSSRGSSDARLGPAGGRQATGQQ